MRIRPSRSFLVVLLVLLVLVACRPPATLRRAFQPPSPHEQYGASLQEAGLHETGLGRAWFEASQKALTAPVGVTLPFREAGYFAPNQATAVAYRFSLRRGQQLHLEWEAQGGEPFRLFLDLYEQADPPKRVASASAGEQRMQFEAERDATFILRVQPELLRGGRYVLTQRVEAALAFPVPDAVNRIHSIFGDPRDAGRRSHEGIDIFAPRGTAAVAAVDGIVREVGTNNLGGNVVWVWDNRRWLSLYYAHLDSTSVASGQRVRVGDTVGFVGNTGNAKGTAPHLHFGVYAFPGGALDPMPFVVTPPAAVAPVPPDLSALGELRRAARRGATMRSDDPNAATRVVARHTVFRVESVSGTRYRVRLPDGTSGFVERRDTEALTTPLRRAVLADGRPILDQPLQGAAVVTSLAPGVSLPVFGEFGGFLLIRDEGGREGWIAAL